MALSKQQETFCQEVVKQDTYSDAYRVAYNVKTGTPKSVNESASKLMANPKIRSRVDELTAKVEKKALYSIERSVKRDLELIGKYESAISVLENLDSLPKDVEVAERTIRYIGVMGYNSAQERLSKQHGFYKEDNSQKSPPTINIIKD